MSQLNRIQQENILLQSDKKMTNWETPGPSDSFAVDNWQKDLPKSQFLGTDCKLDNYIQTKFLHLHTQNKQTMHAGTVSEYCLIKL